MSLEKIIVLGKYELKKYLAGHMDKLTILLVVLTGVLVLIAPQGEVSQLPSGKDIYLVGLESQSQLTPFSLYQIRYRFYEQKLDMMYDSSLGFIDAFIVSRGTYLNAYSSGGLKGDAALTRVSDLIDSANRRILRNKVAENQNLSGILFPIRVTVEKQEINYSGFINATLSGRRSGLDFQRPDKKRQPKVDAPPQSIETPSTQKPPVKAENNVFEGSGDSEILIAGLPSEIKTGFPFSELYRNMMFLSPLLIVGILYALSLAKERVEHNIENLFTAPITQIELILGKSLPYLALITIYSLGVGLLLTGVSADALKIMLIYFTLGFVMQTFGVFAVLVSRNYRELTFIGSFAIFTFFFFIVLPNIFSGVNVLAFISPLDTVLSITLGAQVALTDIIYSLIPYWAMGAFFSTFSLTCFTPETIYGGSSLNNLFKQFFTQLQVKLRNPVVYTFFSVTLLVPAVYVVESISAYLIMPFGWFAPLISFMFLSAIEELVKCLPLFYRKINPLIYSISAGVAFFVTEKIFNAYLISKVYSLLSGAYRLYLVKGLAGTLLLHITTTLIFSSSIYFGKNRFHKLLGFTLAFLIHMLYNIWTVYRL